MFLKGHYQNAYVTHDLKAAMKLLTARYGLKDYIIFEPDMILTTPEGDKPASVSVALAWAGGLQFELIQPRGGFVDHYMPFLPADKSDPSPRYHHMAVRRDDLKAMRAEIAQLNMPLAFEGEVPGAMVYVYLDARAWLGHYLEYVWATDEGWAMNGWPKDRPVW